MRFLPILATLTLAVGCASQPSAPRPEPEPVTKLAATEKPDAKTLEEAQKLGYKIVEREWADAVLPRDHEARLASAERHKPASRQRNWLPSGIATSANFENMKKAIPPPHGT